MIFIEFNAIIGGNILQEVAFFAIGRRNRKKFCDFAIIFLSYFLFKQKNQAKTFYV